MTGMAAAPGSGTNALEANVAKLADVADVPDVVDVSKRDDQHDTLKYHLLGPSLTKAGQDSVDQSKVC